MLFYVQVAELYKKATYKLNLLLTIESIYFYISRM